MSQLPVIVGIGGMNAAGRSSGFHSYKRMIAESLSENVMRSTWLDLCYRMGILDPSQTLEQEHIDAAVAGTLVRQITHFDPKNIPINKHINKDASSSDPRQLEASFMSSRISCAGQIPEGFNFGDLYNSVNHPRGLSLAVYGASDLMNSLGLSWSDITSLVQPDQISVYASSALGQIDKYSMAGLVGNPLNGKRISSKMVALAMADMPGDFVNSYIANNVGTTTANLGACATFLYNLRQGVNDIKQGNAQVCLIGCSEAPIVPELIEGYRTMGALAEDQQLAKLDGTDIVNHRRAVRPFSANAGFTIAESTQFMLLMSDELALKCGANILGAVPDVFVNADGNKKSISAPGIGNYITLMKAASVANNLAGIDLQKTSVQAHGTGTPQNRVTESHVINEVAKTFQIEKWKTTSVKAYVGHSVASAAGDQFAAALGTWKYGYIPGIKTIDHIADDVHQSNMNILMEDEFVGEQGKDMDASFINSKGFGGNNATALLLSPSVTMQMLEKKHGKQSVSSYRANNEKISQLAEEADQRICDGNESVIYNFGTNIIEGDELSLSQEEIKLPQYAQAIKMPKAEEFGDYQ
ncbi:beta-ketoacyl synthase [Alteromonadaceae bacterium M269]|nr:beta-ketoacyl synthase [Alteromonadaceae bacterium M269]